VTRVERGSVGQQPLALISIAWGPHQRKGRKVVGAKTAHNFGGNVPPIRTEKKKKNKVPSTKLPPTKKKKKKGSKKKVQTKDGGWDPAGKKPPKKKDGVVSKGGNKQKDTGNSCAGEQGKKQTNAKDRGLFKK